MGKYKDKIELWRLERKNRAEYWQALGEFVSVFSRVEEFLNFSLQHYARVTECVRRALLSGMRVNDSIGLIRRLANERNTDEKTLADLDLIFTQLALINAKRNDILHYGATGTATGEGIVSNVMRAHLPERIYRFPISAKILNDMTYDLRKILNHLFFSHMRRTMLGKAWQKATKDDDLSFLKEILKSSWKYKPPAQVKNQGKNRRTSPKLSHQP